MAHYKSTLGIGGFDCAADVVRFLRFAGSAFALRAPTPDPTRVIGCKIMAGGKPIGAVVMLRKGATLRVDTLAPGGEVYAVPLMRAAREWDALKNKARAS